MGRVINQIRRGVVEAALHLDTAGPADIVSFSTDVSAPAKSVLASMSPIQDLNGYSNPWPAGGGKNLFNLALIEPFNANVTVTKTADSFTVTNSNEYAAEIFRYNGGRYKFPVSDGQYTISISEATTSVIGVYGSADGETFSWLANGISAGNTSATFTVSGQTYVQCRCACPANGTVTIKQFQFEKGDTKTAYAPYENICPISGRTGLTAYRTGKNLFSGSYVSGGVSMAGGVWSVISIDSRIAVIPCKPNTKYTATKFTASNRFIICSSSVYPVDGTVLTNYYNSADLTGSKSFTTDGNAWYIVIGVTTSSAKEEPQMQVELGSTASAYEAYNGTAYPVTWQTEAGTVYGGTVDVVTGVLTVTHEMVDLGTLTWVSEDAVNPGQARSAASVANLGAVFQQTPVCSVLKGTTPRSYTLIAEGTVCFSNSVDMPFIRVRSISYYGLTDADIKTALTGTQFCYKLSTPQTYQLTPTQIDLLKGVNNVWQSENGDVTAGYWLHG